MLHPRALRPNKVVLPSPQGLLRSSRSLLFAEGPGGYESRVSVRSRSRAPRSSREPRGGAGAGGAGSAGGAGGAGDASADAPALLPRRVGPAPPVAPDRPPGPRESTDGPFPTAPPTPACVPPFFVTPRERKTVKFFFKSKRRASALPSDAIPTPGCTTCPSPAPLSAGVALGPSRPARTFSRRGSPRRWGLRPRADEE